MKIVLTGGGTGGHFYPLIAIAQSIADIADAENLASPRIYYFSTSPYNEELLFENNITYRNVPAGKLRLYFSLKNITDVFKTIWGIAVALKNLFDVYPDVVMGKGGYASFPTVVAAWILRIPIIIHESDSAPGRVNLIVGKYFATRIALSWQEAAAYFPQQQHKIAHTGQPIRNGIRYPQSDGAHEYLELESNIPIVLILGGSQGAQIINETVISSLPTLLNDYQIIHQTGAQHIASIEQTAQGIIADHPHKNRYRPFAYLNDLAMSMSAGIANLVVSRAGSTIFEIAHWGVPSIVVPFDVSNNDHNRKNAYNYARAGAAVVIEERNMLPHVLTEEIIRILSDQNLQSRMHDRAQAFFVPNAEHIIAQEIINLALPHEQ